MSSVVSLYGLGRTLVGNRRWLVLPLLVQGFYLQHQLEGWCPPLPVLRSLGFRTPHEIEEERRALLDLRRGVAPEVPEEAPVADEEELVHMESRKKRGGRA